jgi:RNA 3'-terminal phosphate cyclase
VPVAETTATVTATTKVTIAGIRGSIEVNFDPEKDTLGVVIARAIKEAGVTNVVLETLAPVVNGEDATLTDKVEPGATVAAAPRVRNGL